MTEPIPLQQINRTYVRSQNRTLSYFAGCDYFRLASHPTVLKAVSTGMKQYGLNVAASRLTTGNHEIFGKLEATLSKFFGTKSATLVSNGYVTNLVAAQAMAGEFSHVLIDEKAHPSLQDAAQMFQAEVRTFKNCDPKDLAAAIADLGKEAKIILLADGMFSHDGSISPLKRYLKILPQNAVLLVDDCHGAGTLGKTGKGVVELEKIPRHRVIQTITLSKAFGVYGGAILGDVELRAKIISKSRMFVGSTPLPLPLANAAMASVKTLSANKKWRDRLSVNVHFVKTKLRAAGISVPKNAGPIIPIIPKSADEAKQLQERCLANGVFPSFIKYPGGPENGYFRFVISSEHKKTQLTSLVKSLIE